MDRSATPTGKMTADEFLTWAEGRPDGERYELVDGEVLRMQAENVRHALTKQNVFQSFRDGLRAAGERECRALPDGIGVRVSDDQVREPDALIDCGSSRGGDLLARTPVVVVEVVSPSTKRIDMDRKLIDYFQVPSIRHYLIVLAQDRRVIHHARVGETDEIRTRILGPDADLSLDPPGITVLIGVFFADLPNDT